MYCLIFTSAKISKTIFYEISGFLGISNVRFII